MPPQLSLEGDSDEITSLDIEGCVDRKGLDVTKLVFPRSYVGPLSIRFR